MDHGIALDKLGSKLKLSSQIYLLKLQGIYNYIFNVDERFFPPLVFAKLQVLNGFKKDKRVLDSPLIGFRNHYVIYTTI